MNRYLLQLKVQEEPVRYQEVEARDPKDAVKVYRQKYGGRYGIQCVWLFVS